MFHEFGLRGWIHATIARERYMLWTRDVLQWIQQRWRYIKMCGSIVTTTYISFGAMNPWSQPCFMNFVYMVYLGRSSSRYLFTLHTVNIIYQAIVYRLHGYNQTMITFTVTNFHGNLETSDYHGDSLKSSGDIHIASQHLQRELNPWKYWVQPCIAPNLMGLSQILPHILTNLGLCCIQCCKSHVHSM